MLLCVCVQVEELTKVKQDLEAALKDVLQALRINQGAGAVSVPSLEKLATVSMMKHGGVF